MEESHEICKKGCFNLRKYVSNNLEIMKRIPEELRAKEVNQWLSGGPEAEEPVHMTLGMLWSLLTDTLAYVFSLGEHKPTRRGMLSALGSVYDPLGLISPAVLEGRLILQGLCKQKISWDETVPDDIMERSGEWKEQMNSLRTLRIPRRYMRTVLEVGLKALLRIFTDASKQGYGACAYLVLTDDRGHEDRTLVMAKSRVGPVKPVTVPRLELQAAVLGVKMSSTIQEELPYDFIDVEYYTDSTSVLGYIYNETARHSIFLDNRTQVIREKSKKGQWSHVDTEMNPADIASRGMAAAALMTSELWFHGPPSEYLSEKRKQSHYPLVSEDPEMKKSAVAHTTRSEPRWVLEQFSKYSSWSKMVRVTAWIRRFLKKFAAKYGKKQHPTEHQATLRVDELQEAEDAFVMLVQRESFPMAFKALAGGDVSAPSPSCKKRRRQARKESNIYKLDPYIDSHGLLRVGGRVQSAELPREYIHPRLMPRRHFATEALVQKAHEDVKHSGRNATLQMIRTQGWWIVSGRAAVDRVKRQCVLCRRGFGPVESQKMGSLPRERVNPAEPFTHSACDFLGPFTIKQRRSQVKRWICLFTCMGTRAIHLEITEELSTSSFINAFRRFSNRRGPVRTLKSDCGTNFKGAANEMKRALSEMDRDGVSVGLAEKGCDLVEHTFITPGAPHKGGVWERLVAIVKRTLQPTLALHGKQLTDEMFKTVVSEAEAIVNSRPITPVDMSDADCLPALSPAQILTGKTIGPRPPPGEFTDNDEFSHKAWRRVQYVAEQYWRKWRREYLPLLQERHKWAEVRPNLQVNDIVIIKDENAPRMQWPMGRIMSVTTTAADDLVREVRVKTSTGSYDRAPSKVVLLYRLGEREARVQSQSESHLGDKAEL